MSSIFVKRLHPWAHKAALAACCCAVMGIGAVQAQSSSSAEIAALKAEIESLRRALPGHAHVMAEVDYHFSNLWFAVRNGNWPLAEFYLNETRSNLNWMVRLRPLRRLSNGQDMDLTPIVKAVDDTALTSLRSAIGKQDIKAFEAAYRQTLEQCYACHKIAEKPYLRPQIPEAPAARMINPRVDADWPR